MDYETVCYRSTQNFFEKIHWKTAEATGDLIGNKIINKITRFWKTSLQNNLETNKEMPREKYTSPEIKLKIIDHLRLKEDWYNNNNNNNNNNNIMEYQKIINLLDDATK